MPRKFELPTEIRSFATPGCAIAIGDGYPEVEKLVTLAQTLEISLDSLFALHQISEPHKADTKEESQVHYIHIKQPSDRIAITSFDKKKLLLCYEVRATPSIGTGKIKYALLGITEKGFWGRKEEIIGWYTDIDSINKEINAVNTAIAAGEAHYELQFFVKAELKGLFSIPKIIDA